MTAANSKSEQIFANFANVYELDISKIRKDALKLRQTVAGSSVDPDRIIGENVLCEIPDDLAFVQNIEAIDVSEVDRPASIEIRHIEKNIEEAKKYHQRLCELRRQYMELAKLRNDAKFKGEEFLRLDAVHLMEIDAGLFTLDRDDAFDELDGATKAVLELEQQASIPGDMLSTESEGHKYSQLLTDARIEDFIAKESYSAGQFAKTNQDTVKRFSAITTRYGLGMEFAAWQDRSFGIRGELSKTQARKSSAARRYEYLKKDVSFRSCRASIRRELAKSQMKELSRPGSPINYQERMLECRRFFNIYFRKFVEYAKSTSVGMAEVYNKAVELPSPEMGEGLDRLTEWLVAANDELHRFQFQTRTSIFSILKEIKFDNNDRLTGVVSIEFNDSEHTEKGCLLRGVALELIGRSEIPTSLELTPPTFGEPLGNMDALHFGRVSSYDSTDELKPSYGELLWNVDPNGIWEIKFDNLSGSHSITAVTLYLWIELLEGEKSKSDAD